MGSAKKAQVHETLSRAFEGDAPQMTTPRDELERQVKLNAGLALDEHLWPGTGGGARPAGSGLETRLTASGPASEVDLVRRRALQGHVRAVTIVQGKEVVEGESGHALLFWQA